jgi:glucose-fructose oxidoreductase
VARARSLRWAVVGLGYIAQAAVLPAFRHARRAGRLTALVSSDPLKLRELSAKYDVSSVYSYEQYGQCLQEVDAVYIALPNHLHRDFAIEAARAGVHILCEKPLAVTEDDCERMIVAAQVNGVLLMTAYRLHFERANLRAIELVRSGEIGDPRFFTSAFSMQVRAGNVRLLPEFLGGGPIYDIGIYCINAARGLFASEPTAAAAFIANSGEARFSLTHEMIACQLRFPGERLASFVCGSGAADSGWCQVVGSEGSLKLDPAYELAEGLKLEWTAGGRKQRASYGKRDQFAPELLYFADCIRRGTTPEPSGREGLADVRVIRALLRSAAEGRAVALAPFDRLERQDMSQEMQRPPVDPPELIHALRPGPD